MKIKKIDQFGPSIQEQYFILNRKYEKLYSKYEKLCKHLKNIEKVWKAFKPK